MANQTAFFYGTLMAPGVLYRVCYGTARPAEHQTVFLKIRPALLHGYQRHRVRDADYPGIIASSDSRASVLGTYVTGLTPMDISRLDVFEGSDYDRVKVRAQVLKGSVADVQAGKVPQEVDSGVETEVYVYKDKTELEEDEWDFEQFKREKLKFWTLDNSPEYDDLEDMEKNDGTRGRGVTGSITAQLEADFDQKQGVPETGAEVARAAV